MLTELRFRQKNPPELLELEVLPRGEEPILEAASLPQDLDLFRLSDFTTVLVGTERFVEAVRRLGFEQDILFRELPVR